MSDKQEPPGTPAPGDLRNQLERLRQILAAGRPVTLEERHPLPGPGFAITRPGGGFWNGEDWLATLGPGCCWLDETAARRAAVAVGGTVERLVER
ncbi:MAG: hypothetical protein KF847_20395 [Pirellulales bacterium]|nr:hypothetical protein [Pirellulales bacterium]